jgi:mannose-6-phosphate isomerase-like protein (cupin superfamily)
MTNGGNVFKAVKLKRKATYIAPDGSEIRKLPDVKGGGLAHCTLPSRRTSLAVRHKTVEEIWYFIEGTVSTRTTTREWSLSLTIL